MECHDHYKPKPLLRPRPLPTLPPKKSKALTLVIAIMCCSQALLAWSVHSSRIVPSLPKLISVPGEDVEKRFTDVSIVLRFLLDRARTEPQSQFSSAAFDDTRNDVVIVTVRAGSAFLRSGPSTADSPLMRVSKGTRLAVETKKGDWYRVIAPNGQRTWINKDVIGPAV